MLNKRFSERLNKELDGIDAPVATAERIDVLSKLIKVTKYQAEDLLNGAASPDKPLLNALAQVFEVNADWLLGISDSKSGPNQKTTHETDDSH